MTVTQLSDRRSTTRSACPHYPPCPPASAPDHAAARVVACHPEQGWSLLCNGVVAFDDTGEILPNGACVAPHRPDYRCAPKHLRRAA
jgi:Family of unknown function (DUF5999)